MTAITDTKLRNKLKKETNLELKKTLDMIIQNAYERTNRENTIPKALTKKRNKRRTNPKKWEDSVREQQTRNHVTFATHQTETVTQIPSMEYGM